MAYAKGTYAQGICDTCGWAYPYLDLRKQWNDLKVCPECYDPKAPQLDPVPRVLAAEALWNPRPNVDEEVGLGTVITYGPLNTYDAENNATQVGPYNTIPEVIGTMFPNVVVGDPFKMTGETGTLTVTAS